MKNKLVVHACGGTGINIAIDLKNHSDLGEGFADIEYQYIDTSDNNISKLDDPDAAHRIQTNKNAKQEINGSAGERGTHADDIMESVKKYTDDQNYTGFKNGEYHVIISSASGGSGSVINPMLTKTLVERNIPVINVLVGDNKDLLSANNTLKTIQTLDRVAQRATKKAIPVIYLNNTSLLEDPENEITKLREINNIIVNNLLVASIFMNGVNDELDDGDIRMMLTPTEYKSIQIPPGLYGLITPRGDITLSPRDIPLVGRSLGETIEDAMVNTSDFASHKAGVISCQNLLENHKDTLPIHMVLLANTLVDEVEALNTYVTETNKMLASLSSKSLSDDSDDDTFMF